MDREKGIKLLGLNLGIAVADIIAFSSGLIDPFRPGASTFETALGITIIILSGAGLTYGNYKLLSPPPRPLAPGKWTVDDYIEALNLHRGLKTFERTIDLLIDQIERLQKKNRTIRSILLQIFGDSELSYKKFDAVIAEVEKIFFINIRSILNKMDAFDEDDYNFIRKKYESGDFSKEFMEEKFKVYDEYLSFIKNATEDNEEILLKLDKLLLEISGLNTVESGQIEKMPGMVEIDIMIKQAKYYKN